MTCPSLRGLGFLSAVLVTLSASPAFSETARNIVFVLADDHRYDAMGFVGHPWLETPHMDRMAKGGVHFPKAMVTTSLCSPSRASILTGLYAHNHSVVDNYNPVRDDLVFFPQLLQKAGYETAFIGKWHMGDVDSPQRGFDHWAAFKGQGTYWPDGHGTSRVVPQTSYEGFNVNGKRRPQKGYITDELTDMALDWLGQRKSDKPYFLYVSHKAVHSDFVPADRHRDRYKDNAFPEPATMANTETNYADKPMWLKNQRNSRHGADFGYNLPDFDVAGYYKRYHEALLAVDDGLGRVLDWLEERGELESTLVVYMGDNGFQFGEHGLIDKRVAYEHSIRVPLLFHCPELFKAGTRVERTVANIDIAPTILDIAGVETPDFMDGMSFLDLAKGNASARWRPHTLYEYFWEQNYPQTPTMHALVGDQYKYIRYHGIWDTNELYDFIEDPNESTNLINKPEHDHRVKELNSQLFDVLTETGGGTLTLARDRGFRFPWRHPDKAEQGKFPAWMFKEKEPPRQGAVKVSITKKVAVFGLYVYATSSTNDKKLLHAARILAEYIDNDEDGTPDNPRIMQALLKGEGAIVMKKTDREQIAEPHPEGQGLWDEETIPNGRAQGRFDASLEEVLHMVSDVGWAGAYPVVFGREPGTAISNAMDKARGGRFLKVPEKYPAGAWYSYDDESCDYNCQNSEYIYWAMTSILGGQDFPGRLDDIGHEWKLNTKEKVRAGDSGVYELLTHPDYKLPQALPDGKYQARTFEITKHP